jgi:nucleoside-diphosphate-sugar epimerase
MPLGNTGHDCAAEDAPFGEGAVPSFVAWRPAHERRVLSLARTGFRAIAVRPGFVYGGGYGVFGLLLDLADCRGFIRLPGTGGQHWPLVHIDDVAHLYALVTDRGETGIYHAVADQSVCARDLGEAIAKAAGFPKPGWRSWLLSEARAEIGSLADGLALDQCVTALRARALGWFPQHQDALAEVQAEVQSWKQRKLA